VARNRKRAKERRATRRPGAGNGGRRIADPDPELTPSPIEHATPDVELADAQLAVGRPEPGPGEDLSAEADAAELQEELEDGTNGGGVPPIRRGGEDHGPGRGGEGHAHGPVAEPRSAGFIARLIGFLQGSWRELQRVQWPDRRQVAQATGVVIGFVIVAGVFLGLADLAFSHLMTYILK
jgi:preprotein translocase subunit SecE